MEQINPTRMQLLALDSQISIARQGIDLLQQKRNVLLKELMKIADVTIRGVDEFERVAAEGRYALAMAEAIDGRSYIESASFAASDEVDVDVSGTRIMGVPVPVVKKKNVSRSLLNRGYGITSTNSRIDQIAELFEDQINLIIELAAVEVRLRRLAEEIKKNNRRVNALENVLLPRLFRQKRYVELVLEEREREDMFRLKRVKQRLAQRIG